MQIFCLFVCLSWCGEWRVGLGLVFCFGTCVAGGSEVKDLWISLKVWQEDLVLSIWNCKRRCSLQLMRRRCWAPALCWMESGLRLMLVQKVKEKAGVVQWFFRRLLYLETMDIPAVLVWLSPVAGGTCREIGQGLGWPCFANPDLSYRLWVIDRSTAYIFTLIY